MAAAVGDGWEELPFSRLRRLSVGGAEVEVARQGFTGEHGYELWVRPEDAPAVWDAVYGAGREFGVEPVGFHGHDIARVEAGLIIPGPDYTGGAPDEERGAAIEVEDENQNSPFELGIGRFVDFESGDFIGRDALVAEKEAGPVRRLCGLHLDWSAITAHYESRRLPPEVYGPPRWYPLPVVGSDGEAIGRATSVAWSPNVGALIGFGILDTEAAVAGATVTVRWSDEDGREQCDVPCRVSELPFVKRRRAA